MCVWACVLMLGFCWHPVSLCAVTLRRRMRVRLISPVTSLNQERAPETICYLRTQSTAHHNRQWMNGPGTAAPVLYDKRVATVQEWTERRTLTVEGIPGYLSTHRFIPPLTKRALLWRLVWCCARSWHGCTLLLCACACVCVRAYSRRAPKRKHRWAATASVWRRDEETRREERELLLLRHSHHLHSLTAWRQCLSAHPYSTPLPHTHLLTHSLTVHLHRRWRLRGLTLSLPSGPEPHVSLCGELITPTVFPSYCKCC